RGQEQEEEHPGIRKRVREERHARRPTREDHERHVELRHRWQLLRDHRPFHITGWQLGSLQLVPQTTVSPSPSLVPHTTVSCSPSLVPQTTVSPSLSLVVDTVRAFHGTPQSAPLHKLPHTTFQARASSVVCQG